MVKRILGALAVAACGCATTHRLRLPAEMRPAPMATNASPAKDVVVRFEDDGRTWQLEFPKNVGEYELAIPLANGSPGLAATAADAEYSGTAKHAPAKTSLLVALDQVDQLFRAERYELALVQLKEVELAYPSEARVQAMKGSLYLKLGKPKLARAAWEHALALDPSDAATAAALRALPETP